jgi:hypothetical protein
MPARPLGESDCECVHEGWLAQPVNALSSLAYAAAGTALLIRARRRPPDGGRPPDGLGRSAPGSTPGWLGIYGLATAANGVGGLAYHGPGGPLSRWLHDAALLATLGVVTTAEVGEATGTEIDRRHAAAAAAAGAALAVVPSVSRAAQVGLGLGAAAADVTAGMLGETRRPRHVSLGLIWIAAAAVNAATRTGGPLCRPRSVLQGHAAWHALTALALWWWGRFITGSAEQRRPPVATRTLRR